MKLRLLLFVITFFPLLTIAQVIPSVKIGSQTWMTKNLNVDRFRNGDPIPEAKSNQEWMANDYIEVDKGIVTKEVTKPAWCYYNNNPANGAKYGKLYNWFAVIDPRGLCPAGWHVPSITEWFALEDYLGRAAGTKMKSTSGWESYMTGGLETCPNCKSWNAEYRSKVPCHTCKDTREIYAKGFHSGNGTNESGFAGLPGGGRLTDGAFFNLGMEGNWWSTKAYTDIAHHSFLSSSDDDDGLGLDVKDKNSGFSVRCLKD